MQCANGEPIECLAASAAGYMAAGDAFWQSYLIAYVFWIGITLGSLGILMVQHLTGGAWTMASRRLLEASSRTLPLMALLFIPIWLKLDVIYGWAKPGAADRDPAIHAKAAYLNPQFFALRAVIFFAIWAVLIFILSKWSKEQDEQPAQLPGPADRRSRMLSGPGLVLFVATITFMSIDWVMSLDPAWYSTIFGVLTLGVANKFLEPFAGAVLGKIVILITIILFIQKRPRGLFALKGRAVEA